MASISARTSLALDGIALSGMPVDDQQNRRAFQLRCQLVDPRALLLADSPQCLGFERHTCSRSDDMSPISSMLWAAVRSEPGKELVCFASEAPGEIDIDDRWCDDPPRRISDTPVRAAAEQ